jgi:hypothetical protein
MNKQDTENVLNIVNASYPHYLKHLTPVERKTQLAVWYDLLCGYDKSDVLTAVRKHVETSKYPPSIADVREKIKVIERIKRARGKLADGTKLLTNGQIDRMTEYKQELAKINSDIAKASTDEQVRGLRLKRHEVKCNIEFLRDEELRLQRQAEAELERAERLWQS